MTRISENQMNIIERMQSGEEFPKTETKSTMRTLNSLVRIGAAKFNTSTMRYELTPAGKTKIVK